MITFNCECGFKTQAKDEWAGKRAKCPRCGKSVKIPPSSDNGVLGDDEICRLLAADADARPTSAPAQAQSSESPGRRPNQAQMSAPARSSKIKSRKWKFAAALLVGYAKNRRKLVWILGIIIAVVLPAAGFFLCYAYRPERMRVPASGKNILAALKRLQARTEVGVTKADYTRECGDIWIEVKAFTESGGHRQCPNFSRCVLAATQAFLTASDAWNWPLYGEESGPHADLRARMIENRLQLSWLLAKEPIRCADKILAGYEVDEAAIDKLAADVDELGADTDELAKTFGRKR